MFKLFIKYVKKLLTFHNIDLKDPDYRNSETYKNISKLWTFGYNKNISLDNFIEQYLTAEQNVSDIYTSHYDMGNKYELLDAECEDIALAETIEDIIIEITNPKHDKKSYPDIDADTIVYNLNRTNGLIERLKTSINFDLLAFENKNKQYKCERCKILYLFYMLENIYFPKTNVLKLLSKPSMENIDISLLGMHTYNEMIISMIQDSLEKELPLTVLEKIKSEVSDISNCWDNILKNAQSLMDFFYTKEIEYDFEDTIHILQSDLGKNEIEHTPEYADSPIEILYLRILQLQSLGNVIDISMQNNITHNCIRNAPPEFIEELKQLHYNTIDLNDIENYIDDNAQRISKYVYLKSKTTADDIKRIKNCKKKFKKWLDFCMRAKLSLDVSKISNDLQIISFLQAVILDDSSETFNYTFYGYERFFKHMPRVQAALKDEKHIPDALQCYWVRKVTDHWYANLGRYDERIKLRALEQTCDNILKEILSKPTLKEMVETHKFYLNNKVNGGLITTNEQIQAVAEWEQALSYMGFSYRDDYYCIRYVFQYPPDFKSIYDQLIMSVDYAIFNHLPVYSKKILAITANSEDSICFDLEFAFDYKNKVCIMQNFKCIDIIEHHFTNF